MVSRKIWTGCSIKLENKLYPYALTGNIPEKPKLENTENINKITKLVPLPSKGGTCKRRLSKPLLYALER